MSEKNYLERKKTAKVFKAFVLKTGASAVHIRSSSLFFFQNPRVRAQTVTCFTALRIQIGSRQSVAEKRKCGKAASEYGLKRKLKSRKVTKRETVDVH